MSKIDDMIRKMCPEGVEYKPLRDCTVSISRVDWADDQELPYIDLSTVDRTTHRIGDASAVTETTAPSRAQKIVRTDDVLFGTTRPTLMRYASVPRSFDGAICSTGFCVLRADRASVVPRWLFHVISTCNFFDYVEARQHGGSYPAISDKEVKECLIPVPPLPIQQEIVRILDTFTKLEAELEAELEARKKQYEYYRQQILHRHKEEHTLKVRELGTWTGGSTPSMDNAAYWTDGTIPWISSKDMKHPVLSDTEDHVTQAAVSNTSLKVLPPNTVTLVTRSGILKHTLPIAFVPFSTTVNQDIKALAVSDRVLPKYAYHVLSAYSPRIRRVAKKQGGTVDSLEWKKVLDFAIPVPSIKDQKSIVEALDRFDTLTNDLTSGLPAEIAARRKQYEYYRDKLLTFPRKES